MENLDSLVGGEVEDLETLTENTSTVKQAQLPTVRNISALSSMVSDNPEEAVDAYKVSLQEFEAYGESTTAMGIAENAKQSAYMKDKAALIDILSDPDVDDETKRAVSTTVLDIEHKRYSLQNILATNLAEEEASDDTNKKLEFVRSNFAEEIDFVNENARAMQRMLNMEQMRSSESSVAKIADIAQILFPFVEQGIVNNIDYADKEWPFVFLGSAKVGLQDSLMKMPIAKRAEVARALYDSINENSSLILDDANDLVRMDMLRTVFEGGYYGDGSEFLDNVVSLLDATGVLAPVGSLLSKATKSVRLAGKAKVKNFVRSKVSPVSPLGTAENVNPDKVKVMLKAIIDDPTDETAQALAGTTRADAIGDQLLPQLADSTGVVSNKAADPDSVRIADADGAIYYTEEGLKEAATQTYNNFTKAIGTVARPNMSTFEPTDNGIKIHGMYGPSQQGWTNVEESLDSIEFALRDYGVTRDNLTVMRRMPNGEYVPVLDTELDAALDLVTYEVKKSNRTKGQGKPVRVRVAKPNYLVRVDLDYKFNPWDVTDTRGLEIGKALGVSLNMFDKMKVGLWEKSGTITRHLIDPASLFSLRVFGSANKATERAASLERSLLEFSDKKFGKPFKKLARPQQDAVYEILKWQNKNNRVLNETELASMGFNGDTMEVIHNFREIQDTIYHFENKDLVKSLTAKGMKVFTNKEGTGNYFARPASAPQYVEMPKGGRAYDMDLDEYRALTEQDIQTIYDSGGQVGKLYRPIMEDGEAVTHVITSNTSGKSYARAFTDGDRPLTYRAGYYSVKYDAPLFVTKRVFDAQGVKLYDKAIGTASNSKEANLIIKKFSDADGLPEGNDIYYVREDLNKKGKGNELEEAIFDLNSAGGRSAQRHRGKRLEDGSDPNGATLGDSHVEGPVDSLVGAVRSVARRTAMRPMIEALKKSFLDKYGDVVTSRKFGEPAFPTKFSQIGIDDLKYDSKGGDARTLWEYINYLENGYINRLDEGTKAVINHVAKLLGKKSAKAQEAAYWLRDNAAPADFLKSTAFTLYLALNPLRQVAIQGHQSIQLNALFPKYMATQAATDMVQIMAMRAGMSAKNASKVGISGKRTEQELSKMFQEYMDSGLAASIDKQNLISGSLTETTEYRKYLQSKSVAGNIADTSSWLIRGSRKLGFDMGEEVTMMSSWLAHRNKAVEDTGRVNLTSRDLDYVSAKARNFTYNMTSSGDMPYNQNLLNIPFQFMQVPHKALLQVLTNQGLSTKDKLRVAGFSTLMYAPPAALFGSYLGKEWFDDKPQLFKDTMEQGLEGAMLNGIATMLTGEQQATDYGSFAPFDAGFIDFIAETFSGGVFEAYQNSPSGSLFMGNNPRITNFIEGAYDTVTSPKSYESADEFLGLLKEFISLSSGGNNIFKAQEAIELRKVLDSTGNISDFHVTEFEGLMKQFGLPTLDESFAFKMTKDDSDRRKELVEMVADDYKSMRKVLKSEGINNRSDAFVAKAVSMAWIKYGNDAPLARMEMWKLVTRDAKKGDYWMMNHILNKSDLRSTEESINLLRNVPNVSEEDKQQAIDMIRAVARWKVEEEEQE